VGRRGSNVSYGKRWAEVSATPFRLFKSFSAEGGVSVPALARLPKSTLVLPAFAGLGHVSDLAPTFLELAGVRDPGSSYKGRAVHPITGHSLLPVLEGRAGQVRAPGEPLADELFGRRYVRTTRWKLSWNEPPYGSGTWALYDIERDRGETTDLARQESAVLRALVGEWDRYARRVGVVLPTMRTTPGHSPRL
jgi:arylsulfatase